MCFLFCAPKNTDIENLKQYINDIIHAKLIFLIMVHQML